MRHILQGFTMYLDGLDFGIDTETIELPFPVPVMQEYRGGGMDLAVSQPMSAIEALAINVKMAGLNPDIMARMALAPGQVNRLTFRAGVLTEATGSIASHLCVAEGRINGNSRDTWSRGEKAGFDFSINGIIYMRYEADARIIHELQAWPPKRIVNGIDQLATLNAALGY
ncbi:P2 family phage contractile tail tube protein [Peteryoungia aggregata LMG 23059]|uniref:P2 family phage contractile tail tube protein n=1 Tax=Peteryoungia aggregata LMG 23059 TaxID=1368425 RepID=A0ABU0GA94_9HYPH|nr:phage major tail tube protein [Peteryoungia aggregata]MDQ0422281.1 P2 family phage contractile tail tube protein [Peteryoungia aggregata LMG 23059]